MADCHPSISHHGDRKGTGYHKEAMMARMKQLAGMKEYAETFDLKVVAGLIDAMLDPNAGGVYEIPKPYGAAIDELDTLLDAHADNWWRDPRNRGVTMRAEPYEPGCIKLYEDDAEEGETW